MKHQTEPLVKLEIGTQTEEYEFLVDTGADRSSALELPRGCNVSDRKCKVGVLKVIHHRTSSSKRKLQGRVCGYIIHAKFG